MAGEASMAAATSASIASVEAPLCTLHLDVRRFGMAFAGAVDERAGQPIVIDDADFDRVERDAALPQRASGCGRKGRSACRR